MSKKLTKEEVKKPDPFIHYTDKAIAWIEKHGKSIGTVIMVLSLGGAGYVGVNKYQKNQEQKAQTALYNLRVQMEKLTENFNKEDKKENKGKENKSSPEERAQEAPKKDFNTHYATLIGDYKKFFKDYAKSNSEKAGTIQLANLYAENEKWEEVISLLSPKVSSGAKDSFYFGMMSMLLSQAQMNSEQCPEAIKVLEAVSAQATHKHLHPESLLRIGICYENQQDYEKAKQYFERVSRDFEESEAATNAKYFLRYLALKGNA